MAKPSFERPQFVKQFLRSEKTEEKSIDLGRTKKLTVKRQSNNEFEVTLDINTGYDVFYPTLIYRFEEDGSSLPTKVRINWIRILLTGSATSFLLGAYLYYQEKNLDFLQTVWPFFVGMFGFLFGAQFLGYFLVDREVKQFMRKKQKK